MWRWEIGCTDISVPDEALLQVTVLLLFLVICRLCLFKGNRLFVFEYFYLNCAFIGVDIIFVLVNDIFLLFSSFFFLSITILLRCTVTDIITGSFIFCANIFLFGAK